MGAMKKGKRATLWLLALGYAVSAAVAVVVFASETRYECYSRRGASGVFWCPESATRGPVLIRKSLIWPYYAYRAMTS